MCVPLLHDFTDADVSTFYNGVTTDENERQTMCSTKKAVTILETQHHTPDNNEEGPPSVGLSGIW